jgi:DNA-binding transcriptional LysR family regulator
MRFTNFDMDALRSFVIGMDAGSFARAAERLGRSTSAVSAQLKKLEEQSGVAIMRRAGRGLALTESGEALLSYARRLLALNDEAIGAVRGVELEGWVRLGLQADFGETILPQVLGRFARAHPRVRIEGRTARNRELADSVAAGRLDLALAWDDGRAGGERIASIPITWLGAADSETGWQSGSNDPLPIVALGRAFVDGGEQDQRARDDHLLVAHGARFSQPHTANRIRARGRLLRKLPLRPARCLGRNATGLL